MKKQKVRVEEDRVVFRQPQYGTDEEFILLPLEVRSMIAESMPTYASYIRACYFLKLLPSDNFIFRRFGRYVKDMSEQRLVIDGHRAKYLRALSKPAIRREPMNDVVELEWGKALSELPLMAIYRPNFPDHELFLQLKSPTDEQHNIILQANSSYPAGLQISERRGREYQTKTRPIGFEPAKKVVADLFAKLDAGNFTREDIDQFHIL